MTDPRSGGTHEADPREPSSEAIAAYWRAWSLTPLTGGERDSQESHLNGLRAAYAVDFAASPRAENSNE